MDHPDLARTVAAAGFRIAKIRYYTPIVGGFFENIVMRVGERFMSRRAERAPIEGRVFRPGDPGSLSGGAAATDAAIRQARLDAKRRIARRGPLYAALKAATWLMKLDLVLFGRIQSGPFFALLVKEPASNRAQAR